MSDDEAMSLCHNENNTCQNFKSFGDLEVEIYSENFDPLMRKNDDVSIFTNQNFKNIFNEIFPW